jgi:hypothetical protein
MGAHKEMGQAMAVTNSNLVDVRDGVTSLATVLGAHLKVADATLTQLREKNIVAIEDEDEDS